MEKSEGEFKYNITYNVESGQWTKQEVRDKIGTNEHAGACSELGLLSVVLPPDGSYSLLPIGYTAEGKEWDGLRWFKVWTLLASKLAEDKTLSLERRVLAASTFDAFLKSRGIQSRKVNEVMAEQAVADTKGNSNDLN